MISLVVCAVETLSRFSSQEMQDCAWVYLGKDLRRRERTAGRLGEKGLVPLGDRLHEVAEKLRQPFLDFIAELGRIQTDQLGWWSSSCSWKDTGTSDLFLLICYECLIEQLIREREKASEPLVVVIEDPWLFRQLADAYRQRPEIRFHGRVRLWTVCARAFGIGLASRLVWGLRLLKNYVSQARRWEWEKTSPSSRPLAALYSYPQPRCLRGSDEWTDPYLGDLNRLLERAGYSIRRFSPPEIGGFEEALRRRSRYFLPLILCLRFPTLVSALLASWRAVWPRDPMLAGQPVAWLLRREYWNDRWRSSHFLRRVFFACICGFLKAERPSLVIFPYENQPWEKMLVLAARAQGVSTLGYQHGAGLARLRLAYFQGKEEHEFAPLPDVIVTSGPYAYDMLSEGGTPPDRLIMGGSLRYQYLCRDQQSVPLPPEGSPIRILVALPIEPAWAEHLLDALRRSFPDGGRSEELEFVIRPHPMAPVSLQSFAWPAVIGNGALEEAVRPCALVMYTATSTGVEALAMGRKVLRYRSELLLDLDVAAFIGDESIVDCGDHDMRAKVLALARESAEPRARAKAVTKDIGRVFVPAEDRVWMRVIGELSRRCA